MVKRKKIKLGTAPVYPADAEAKEYAAVYRDLELPGNDPHTAFKKFWHSSSIDVLACWGVSNIFFVYAYPPAGFIVDSPEDAGKLVTFEGWILQYNAKIEGFNTLVKASRDGVDFFWQEHHKYNP
ncbi:MAG: hypothetical protein HWN68_18450 [Desulfobacterales bacterium]|nr:hypothetical protein [Desulfobacterales bacterium]